MAPAPAPREAATGGASGEAEGTDEAGETAGPPGDEAPPAVWPDESAEAAFIAEEKAKGEPGPARGRPADPPEEADLAPLPPLAELVDRIPADVRETLEDLFRARFVTVKRIPRRALKDQGRPGGSTHSGPTTGRPETSPAGK